ncbi:hypothetical protein GWC84_10120, partial [Neisseria meningitidis]|nr:hypothetical protein [Neisseria meningitidis]
CLLDEVDAPLDDANTSRFCNLVKEMSAQTQFLYLKLKKTETFPRHSHESGNLEPKC